MNWKKTFNSPTVALLVLLIVALAGFQAVTAREGVHLIKQAAPLREQLFLLPAEVGPYRKISEDRLTHEAVEELGTDQFISWVYEDTRVQPGESGREVRLHVAYYTGSNQTLPHIADRCYTAGVNAMGLTTTQRTVTLKSPRIYTAPGAPISATLAGGQDVQLATLDVPISIWHFKPGPDAAPSAVVYLFFCNGKLVASGPEVQAAFADLHARRGYWCRIEVQPRITGGDDELTAVTGRFLSRLLPEIQACLPAN